MAEQTNLDLGSCEEVLAWARDGKKISKRSRERILKHAEREGGPEALRVVERILREAT